MATKKKIKSKSNIYNLTVPKDYSLSNTGITQGLLTTFMSCQFKFLYKLNRWSHPKKNKVTLFGSMTHDILEKIYSHFRKRKTIARDSTIEKWINNWPEDRSDILGVMQEDVEMARAKCYVILTEYVAWYSEDFKDMSWTDVETVFEVKHNNVIMRGKRDGRFLEHKKPWLLETKTKSKIDEDAILLRLVFDLQNLFYVTADEMETGEELAGVLYNVIRNPGHRLKVGETLYDYTERIRQDIQSRPEHFFKRYETPYREEDKLQFDKEFSSIIKEVQDFLDCGVPSYKNTSNCESPYKCEFLEACASGSLAGYRQADTIFPELHIGI